MENVLMNKAIALLILTVTLTACAPIYLPNNHTHDNGVPCGPSLLYGSSIAPITFVEFYYGP